MTFFFLSPVSNPLFYTAAHTIGRARHGGRPILTYSCHTRRKHDDERRGAAPRRATLDNHTPPRAHDARCARGEQSARARALLRASFVQVGVVVFIYSFSRNTI